MVLRTVYLQAGSLSMRDLTTVVCWAYSSLNNISKSPFLHKLVIEKNTTIFAETTTRNSGIPSLNKSASGNSEVSHRPSGHPASPGDASSGQRSHSRDVRWCKRCNSALVGAWPFGLSCHILEEQSSSCPALSRMSRRKGSVFSLYWPCSVPKLTLQPVSTACFNALHSSFLE